MEAVVGVSDIITNAVGMPDGNVKDRGVVGSRVEILDGIYVPASATIGE